MNRKTKGIISVFLFAFLLLFLGTAASTVQAEEPETKTVKVGYWITKGFQEGREGEYKTGQSYEYLQKIAGYTGWTYEYEYGSFLTLLDKLEKGEIDLMANLSYTDKRAECILYGQYEQGKESYYLYTKGNEAGIRADDYSTINGKKIGVNAGLYQNILWENWCRDNGIECEIVEFISSEEREAALNDGRIDATIGSMIVHDAENAKEWKSILHFGDSPYYFGVNKNRPDLLEELNDAQALILDENPYYNEELSTQYMRTGLAQVQLKENEIQWLKLHEGRIRVGCLDHMLPLSARDENGELKGVIPDLLSGVEKAYSEYQIHFEIVAYEDYPQMLADLKSDKIDLAAPVYGDYWNADQEGVSLTNSFMSTTMLLLNSRELAPDEIKQIGIDQESPIQSVYVQIYYPQYEVIMYPSMTETAEALVKGAVDVALSSACCYHVNAKIDDNIKNLNRSTLPNDINIAMAVSKKNPELMSFMNRGIAIVGETQIYNSLAVNSNVEKKTTLIDYVSENPVTVIGVSCGIIAFLILIIVRLKKAVHRAKTDSMTGLLNKAAMHEQINEQMRHGGVLFMIDIDNFKTINDLLGHKAGDQVINHFSESLRRIFRSGDIIGRFGGDEFIVFLPGSLCNEEIIKRKVNQMQKALGNCDVLENNREISGSVSVGVLIVEANKSSTFADVFEKVDSALYEAKKNGKKTYVIAK